jgi:hypothetical protein
MSLKFPRVNRLERRSKKSRPQFKRAFIEKLRDCLSLSAPDVLDLPVQEIRKQLQTRTLTFFGVGLDGEDIVPGNRRGKGAPVVGSCDDEVLPAWLYVVTMNKIEAAARRDPVPKRMALSRPDLIPAHMGDL